MGTCIRFNSPPSNISITIPGGAKLTSQNQQTHSQCGPVNSMFQTAAPALGAIQPAFDIVGFVMAFMEFQLCILALLGAMLALTGNPALASMFPLPTIKNTAENEPIPGFAADEDTGVPDVKCVLDNAIMIICKALKLIGLIPQLSMIVTLKDSLNALLAMMSCIQAKFNTLTDAAKMIPGPTGDSEIDKELDCARESMTDFFAHAAGPLVNVIPIFQLIGKLAEPIQKGMPAPVANLIITAINLGLIPFPDEQAKTQFLGVIEDLQKGKLIEIPDLSDISSLPAKMDEVREKLGPVLGAIEQVQRLTEKLQNC